MALRIGTAEARPGELSSGAINVGRWADGGRIDVPVMIASGHQAGPTTWITACLHGEEYGGAVAAIRFLRQLDLAELRGTVVAVPVASPPSFRARMRFSPLDGLNLNRIFPGRAEGSHSQQLAAALREALAASAGALLDLHSGGIGVEVPFFAVYDEHDSDTGRRNEELAMHVGTPVLWRSRDVAGFGGAITAEALRLGIPSVTVEVGGGTLQPQHLRDYAVAIRGFLQAAGCLPGDPPRQEQYTIIGDGPFVYAREGGFFVRDCAPGDLLNGGDLIGHMIDLTGETIEAIRCPIDNAFIAALTLPYFPTHAGEIVAEAFPVEEHRPG